MEVGLAAARRGGEGEPHAGHCGAGVVAAERSGERPRGGDRGCARCGEGLRAERRPMGVWSA